MNSIKFVLLLLQIVMLWMIAIVLVPKDTELPLTTLECQKQCSLHNQEFLKVEYGFRTNGVSCLCKDIEGKINRIY